MKPTKWQVIEGGRLSAEIRRSIHSQIFRLGQSPREVGQRNRVDAREALRIAIEVEREDDARRDMKVFAAGRRSLLTAPPATAARRAA